MSNLKGQLAKIVMEMEKTEINPHLTPEERTEMLAKLRDAKGMLRKNYTEKKKGRGR